MSLRPNDKVVSFDRVICKKETDNALLCLIDGAEHWIPKSQLSDDSEVFDDANNSEGQLVVSEWIANAKGLV
jgi:hypothetical protein